MIGTDHADYAEWIIEVLEGHSALTLKHPATYVSEIVGRNPTKYEQKVRVIGSRIHFFEWVNTSVARDVSKPEQ
jgi:tRNA G46 methylase TrmB